MKNSDYIKLQKVNHKIGLKLIKFTKDKKKIAILGLTKEHLDINDLFSCLCYIHNSMNIGENNISNTVYDTMNTKLDNLYHNYNIIILIDGVRFAKDYDIRFSIIDKKIIKLTYFTPGIFTNENIMKLFPNFDYGIYDSIKLESGDYIRKIKKEYEYLIK